MDYEKSYLEIVKRVLGAPTQPDRTEHGMRCGFVESLLIPLRDIGTVPLRNENTKLIPLLTTKKVLYDKVTSELIWFLRGETNVAYLHKYNNHIWDANTADTNGELGPGYGYQWRNFNGQGVDQIKYIIDEIKRNPYSRRLLVSAWNPAQLNEVALPACHYSFQFQVTGEVSNNSNDSRLVMDPHPKYLNCAVNMRSADVLLGVPFNIASYATLTHLIATACGLQANMLHLNMTNPHIYEESTHIAAAEVVLKREPMLIPSLELSDRAQAVKTVSDMMELEPQDFIVKNYQHHPFVKINMIK